MASRWCVSLLVATTMAMAGAIAVTPGAALVHDAQPPPTATRPTSAPPAFDVIEKSILELQNAMQAGTVSSRQIVEQYLARIEAYDRNGPRLGAFISLNPRALEEAAALDEERRTRGARGALHGIPIAITDNYATEGIPTTGASLALESFQTGRDAFQVKKLRDAGAVIIGKSNLHELAYGNTGVSSLGGQTRNPYDPARNAGGSSAGAVVAASFAAAGLGTDACGSIRIPAAHNNLVGLRGTIGLSSRDGIIPLSRSQDIGGPLARSITDLALMLDATVGFDPSDSATRASEGHIPRTYLSALNDVSLGYARIGVLTALFGDAPEDREVASIVRGALDAMAGLGAGIVEVEIPLLQMLLQGTSLINAEFKFDLMDFLARYPGAPVRSLDDLLSTGLYHTAVDGVLRQANDVAARDSEATRQTHGRREELVQAIAGAMLQRGFHAFAYPTLRRKAAALGQGQSGSNCHLSAATGFPALSLPAGFTADGLPVGIELLGPPFSEGVLLKMANAYEQMTSPRQPPPSTPRLPQP